MMESVPMNRLIACVLLLSCATVSGTFTNAHRDSLVARASEDLFCAREQVAVAETDKDANLWRADGCGRTGNYRLLNPKCLVERDCNWEKQ
jgi:hypothetical protein